jgi:hypothetical protein
MPQSPFARNHLAYCYHASLSLEVQAKRLGKTLCQVNIDLFRDYLHSKLAKVGYTIR